ncbi:nif11-like leader peptide domain protein [Synechococcus sp. BIOS-E4-1]|uniref:Nif11-like leader peptide family RiPP precursor n=1 Tax=Synechococcus sp. BIOS-E4-1 TaxID=1400864 RepID=UPI00186032D6|nr:Nif11-like leader peptide family RiPP precursor [Synechococcus sp. BIOS-E4-1]QNI53836.1 nif11-like leader peptide domain protein [Synechococcus sp. BIOS-E4-1]
MSAENFRSFVSALKSDTKLQQTLKDRLGQEKTQEAMLSVADEAGFSFEVSHVFEAGPQLSEKELEGISGGGDLQGGAGLTQKFGV